MRVLVTRIEPAASRLAALLREDGHEVFTCPALAIVPQKPMSGELAAARMADAWLFASVPAVEIGWLALAPATPPPCFAVGPATAAALRTRGVEPGLAPGSGAAEQLLTLPALEHLQGRHVAVIRGRGGLDALPAGLAARGARVTLLEVYTREPLSPAQLRAAWQAQECVVASSGDGVRALVAAAGHAHEGAPASSGTMLADELRAATLLVPSARVAELAHALGFLRVIVCAGADDAAVRAALRAG